MKLRYFTGALIAAVVLTTFLGCGFPGFKQDQGAVVPKAEEKIAFVGAENNEYNLYVAKEDGSSVKKLTTLNRVEGLMKPLWSPNGSKILFQYRKENNAGSALYVINSAGGDPTEITKEVSTGGERGKWLDDNRVLFVATDKGKNYVYSVDSSGVNSIKVASDTTKEFIFLGSKNEVIYQDQKTLTVKKVSLETKADEKVLDWNKAVIGMTLAPNGTQMAFVSEGPKKGFYLYLFDFEKNALTKLVPLTNFNVVKPEFEIAFTPDSTRMVFPYGVSKKERSLVVMGVVDKRITPLTTAKTVDNFVTVCRSQDKALFSREAKGLRSLMLFDLNAQEEKELINSQYNPLSSDWQ